MKRHGNLFEKIVAPENIFKAYKKAARGRHWQRTVKSFEKDLEANLEAIRKSLIDKTYTTSDYRSKKVYEPKERDIYILPFAPDRIIQHALMNIVAPIWDNMFIHDSYACRQNKGMHRASTKTAGLVRAKQYVLHCDISKFYPSINHDILTSIVERKIKCPDTLWLLKDIINSFPGETNTPIGNLTSQWFGNLYMNEVDQWIKNNKKFPHYIRYCDDFMVFDNDKKKLQGFKIELEDFLHSRLKLNFSKAEVYPTSKGVEFVGYRHFKNFILVKKSTVKRMKVRLRELPELMLRNIISIEQARSSFYSIKGWLKWANTYNLQKKLQLI